MDLKVAKCNIAFLSNMRCSWALGIGHWAWGIGHGALAKQEEYLTFLRTAIVKKAKAPKKYIS
jgi:hypothetical protein